MLNDEEMDALEELRQRPGESYWAEKTLADAIMRLYPPGWDEPVTPERLVELGGLVFSNRPWCVSFQGAEFAFSTDGVLREMSVAVAGRTWQLLADG